MSRRLPSQSTGLMALGALLTVPLLAACSSAVSAVTADRANDPACQLVAERWPQTVADRSQVPTTADSPTVVAWGDPPIVARCGLTSPGPTTLDCISVDGVDWIANRLDDGVAFITYGRDPAVEVLVPTEYAPEPMVLGPFSTAVEVIPQGERRCR